MKPSEDLKINTSKINDELKNQPLMFYKYLSKKNELKNKLKQLSLDLKVVESDILKGKDTSKLKAKEIESLLLEDDEVLALREQILELESTLESFEDVVKAVHQRHECLKEISMNLRREIID